MARSATAYQRRILSSSDDYRCEGHIHVAAARRQSGHTTTINGMIESNDTNEKAIDRQLLKRYAEDFNSDRANLVAADRKSVV